MLAIVTALAFQASSMGDFVYTEINDPINDSLGMVLTLKAEDAELMIVCDHSRSKTVWVRFAPSDALDYSSSPLFASLMPFHYRVDDKPPVIELVGYGARAVDLEGPQARALAERLANGSQIVVRVNGLSQAITATFRANGSRAAIRHLAERCGDTRLKDRLARSSGAKRD